MAGGGNAGALCKPGIMSRHCDSGIPKDALHQLNLSNYRKLMVQCMSSV